MICGVSKYVSSQKEIMSFADENKDKISVEATNSLDKNGNPIYKVTVKASKPSFFSRLFAKKVKKEEEISIYNGGSIKKADEFFQGSGVYYLSKVAAYM